jgi:hypothetical protein
MLFSSRRFGTIKLRAEPALLIGETAQRQECNGTHLIGVNLEL